VSHAEGAARQSHRRTIAVIVVVAAVSAGLIALGRSVFIEPTPMITGTVIGQDGAPIAGATVADGDDEATTAADGSFRLSAHDVNEWVTTTHPDFEARVRAAQRGRPPLVRLTPDPQHTVTMHFAGDVMFGGRFYDPNEDGDPSDGLLPANAGVAEHYELLKPIATMLGAADLSIVDLDTPLIDDPTYALDAPRPDRFHPTKDSVFASEPAAAAALHAAGVDIVDLGNSHIYDALDAGVVSTIDALDTEGVLHYGAGRNLDEAWTPAVATVGDTTIAFLGCTTITGAEQAISSVAGTDKGGAAACDNTEIRARVADAAARYDTVVFSIHGGREYDRNPTSTVQAFTRVAREAGARVVVNHHPQVTGGFDWTDGTLTAWSMGDFVFDQTTWPTFGSYMLAVAVRDDQVVRAYVEPLMIERFTPRGTTGDRGIDMAREAAGRASGPFLIENGAMEVDLAGTARSNDQTVSLVGPTAISPSGPPNSIMRVDDGTWISAVAPGAGSVRFGRDLLMFGTFENEAVDPDRANGSFWQLTGANRRTSTRGAYRGTSGAELASEARQTGDTTLSPLHRIPVTSASDLSITGMVSTVGAATVTLQLSWYQAMSGPSIVQTTEVIVDRPDSGWQSFRLDVTVPESVVAVGLYVRLDRPTTGVAREDLDDLAIIEWAPGSAAPSVLYDHVRVSGTVDVTLTHDWLAGGEAWALIQPPVAMPAGSFSTHVVTVPIEPPPDDSSSTGDD
jgi:Bacterial capsule synthesis protein PGA_cap